MGNRFCLEVRRRAWRRDYDGGGHTEGVAPVRSRTIVFRAGPSAGDCLELSNPETSRPRKFESADYVLRSRNSSAWSFFATIESDC